MPNHLSVAPSARRLTRSLRDIGYSFESAIADLVDNSITAGANTVQVSIIFEGKDSMIRIIDDGSGMDDQSIDESMRFGTRRTYDHGDLGRYGLGLKTATLSQARRLEVVSLTRSSIRPVARTLDLDYIDVTDRWEVLDTSEEPESLDLQDLLPKGYGTIITWRNLDRLLPVKSPEGGWARRRIEGLSDKLADHLSMVFHRYLEGINGRKVSIEVNGEPLSPWDPFALGEPSTSDYGTDEFEIEHNNKSGTVRLHRYLLPTREEFSCRDSFEAASGPEKWNKQQGIYVYRADRLVQWGGWAGIRTIDEHTKMARCALDFGTDLDEAFNINVAKMRVTLPSQLRKMLSRPVNELCIEADAAYRRSMRRTVEDTETDAAAENASIGNSETGATIGLAIKSAAARTGNYTALKAISELLREEMPEIADHLGL